MPENIDQEIVAGAAGVIITPNLNVVSVIVDVYCVGVRLRQPWQLSVTILVITPMSKGQRVVMSKRMALAERFQYDNIY